MGREHRQGPQATSRERRRETIQEIATALRTHFASDLLALGLFGSSATDSDGPYSDIELHCIVRGSGIETRLEWSTGPWKAEVDVCSRDRALARAAELDGTWPLTHGAFVRVRALDDSQGLFAELRRAALQHSDGEFRDAIKDVAIGDIYELVAKLRNLRTLDGGPALPSLAAELGKYAGCLVGLLNRHLYSTGSEMLAESLQLAVRPAGYDALCELLAGGSLGDIERVGPAADAFWRGVEEWSDAEGLELYEDLAAVLKRDRSTVGPADR
jgi:kanamycin nucleotidyltransferase